jgi:hypothetical protein
MTAAPEGSPLSFFEANGRIVRPFASKNGKGDRG